MPLREGSSERAMDDNRSLLWREYRRTGKIGNTRPKNKEHARDIIEAIVHDKAGKSRK